MPTLSIHKPSRGRAETIWIGLLGASCGAMVLTSASLGRSPPPGEARSQIDPAPSSRDNTRAETGLPWRLNNPEPHLIPEDRANPSAVADKLAARVRAMEERARLRAYESAPPVIPHAITDLNVQSCRVCHAEGLKAGDKVARMVSHTYLTNCTQCHVDASVPLPTGSPAPENSFAGLRASGYGGTRAWAGAPPVMPHSTFMRTNCVSCHGEHGYDGWRPDHLSRTNCVQCHAPAAAFDQLSPTFNTAPSPFPTMFDELRSPHSHVR